MDAPPLGVLKNNVDAAAALINHKADINAQTRGGWTPLHVAAYKENVETLQLLIDKNADPDITDNRPNTSSNIV